MVETSVHGLAASFPAFEVNFCMPITVYCPCENPYRVRDELAGKMIKCPFCQKPVSVPLSDVDVFQELRNHDVGSRSDPRHSLEGRAPATFADGSQDDGYTRQRFDSLPTQPSVQPPGPAVTEREAFGQVAQSHADQTSQPPKSMGVNRGKVLLGLVMMVGAALWFFYSLSLNKRFPRGAVFLFVFGLISFVKGLSGSSD